MIHSVNMVNDEEKRLIIQSSSNQEQYNDNEKREILKRFVQLHFQDKYKPTFKKGRIFRKEKTDCFSETLNELHQVEETTEDVTIPLSS